MVVQRFETSDWTCSRPAFLIDMEADVEEEGEEKDWVGRERCKRRKDAKQTEAGEVEEKESGGRISIRRDLEQKRPIPNRCCQSLEHMSRTKPAPSGKLQCTVSGLTAPANTTRIQWEEEWRTPVGYRHATAACSTLDGGWRWRNLHWKMVGSACVTNLMTRFELLLYRNDRAILSNRKHWKHVFVLHSTAEASWDSPFAKGAPSVAWARGAICLKAHSFVNLVFHALFKELAKVQYPLPTWDLKV